MHLPVHIQPSSVGVFAEIAVLVMCVCVWKSGPLTCSPEVKPQPSPILAPASRTRASRHSEKDADQQKAAEDGLYANLTSYLQLSASRETIRESETARAENIHY